MLVLAQLDLADADLATFEEYEAKVLSRLGVYGGSLQQRLRAVDGSSEFHLLRFPDAEAFEAFKAVNQESRFASTR